MDTRFQLRDVKVQESDPDSKNMRSAPESARAAAMLERQPLRFSFQDGVVEELCPSEDDELWALNVKRGILSAFQNSMSRLDSDQTVTEVSTGPSYHVEWNNYRCYMIQSKMRICIFTKDAVPAHYIEKSVLWKQKIEKPTMSGSRNEPVENQET